MSSIKCEELEGFKDWSLARQNACHISVANNEMGEVQKNLETLNSNNDSQHLALSTSIETLSSTVTTINTDQQAMSTKLDYIAGFSGAILFSIVMFVVTSVLKKTFNNKKV